MAAPAHIARENGKKGGRPKGSTNKANIYDYWTKDDIAEYFEYLKDAYKESDKLNQFVGEQLMGKAQQAVDVTSGGNALQFIFDTSFNAPPQQTEGNSK